MPNRFCILAVTRRILVACLVAAGLASIQGAQPSAALAQEAGRSTSKKDAAAAIPEGKLLDRDTIGIAVIQAEPICQWPLFSELRKRGAFKNPERAMQQVLGVELDNLERVVLAIDQELVNHLAKQIGFAPSGVAADNHTPREIQNRLKQIALCFHNYHEVYGKLPRADGDGEGRKTGLSWRVHILPYLEQAPLYEQFHLDEAWDSPHNKPLVEKMPDFFRTPGVKEAGKTAFHVFTGKGTAFEGKQGKTFAAFTDGMSNSMLAVAAAPGTAVEWTKPGGLEFDRKTCRDLLGKFDDGFIQAVMADGAIRQIPGTIGAGQLALLIQINDGQPIEPFDAARSGRSAPPIPTVILTLARPVDSSPFAALPSKETIEGETIYGNPLFSVWIHSEKTLVIGRPESLKRLVRNQKSKAPTISAAVGHLVFDADISIGLDTASQSSLLEAMAAAAKNPLVEVFSSVTALSIQANVSRPAGGKLLEIVAVAADQDAAENLLMAVSPSFDQIRETLARIPISTMQPQAEKGRGLAVKALRAAEIGRDANRVTLRIPVPEGFDALPELVRTLMPQDVAAEAAARTERMNNLKRVALAFHNYHDAMKSFPGAGRPAGAAADKNKAGLSWRVHVLPYIDEAALYKQFRLDEPWDSEHNKTLIERMPAVYGTTGVEKAGETAIHVFTGKGAPFAEDSAPRLRDFTDGTSNTLLAVEAAPDKAEVWTKPGGLDFDPKKPIEALGTLPGNTFLSVMADGSVQNIAKTVNADHLRRLILLQDGEPLR